MREVSAQHKAEIVKVWRCHMSSGTCRGVIWETTRWLAREEFEQYSHFLLSLTEAGHIAIAMEVRLARHWAAQSSGRRN